MRQFNKTPLLLAAMLVTIIARLPAIRPSPQPVNDITNTMNPVYLKSWVAEITLVHPNGEVIDAFMDNQAQMKQLQVRAPISQILSAIHAVCSV